MQDKLYDLTNPQKSIWYTEEVLKGTTVNNICTSGIIYENIDANMLKRAINNVVKQHDSFRIRIVLQNNQVKQYISEFKSFEIETEYISNKSELKQIQEEQANYKFDILNSDLFRFKIVILKDEFACVILTVNHIISDSWSMGITIQEILRNYYELKHIHPTNLSINNTAISSYIDYISSEIEYKNSQKYEKDKAYWNKIFKTIPEQATIPASLDLTKLEKGKSNKIYTNDIYSNKANRFNFDINKNTVNKIHDFCSKNNFSVFNFFMAIFSIYIGRVSNTEDFVIGTPILNRTNFKEKHTTGMFVNTVPVRVNNFNSGFFKDLVNSFSKKFREILRHQKYSYTSILEDLRTNNKNIPSLYNIMISYQVTKAFDENFGNYVTDWTFNNYITDDIDIHIYDINDTGKLSVSYDYLINKYELEDIKAIHERIIFMINQVLDNEDILTNDIEIITKEEKYKILNEFNNTKVDYPKDKTIVDLFEEQAEKSPNNIAIVFENEKLTYKELNEKANSLAFCLRENKNIGRNDLVGIMVNRSLEMIISILAVLKAGGCYIPIDPTYPKDRINYMLNSSKSKLLLTQEKLKNRIDFKDKLCIDLSNKNIYSMPNKNLKNINKPEDLAYVIFTSGSTGKPKGVMLMHKALSNLTNYCNNYIEYLKTETQKTIVSITTVSFDIFIFESLISLQKGLKLVIANENEQTSPEILNSLIEKHNVQIIQSTPSRMKIFVDNINTITSLKKLKYITLAGEQLPLSLVNQLQALSGAIIYNGYGPSETTVFSTLTKMNNNYITIGKPLDNTKIYILDKNLKPVPIGITGELYIAGDGVGKGYLGNKELTSKNFIPNPFIENTIMYKTGDLGKYNKDGKIICLGRADNQVKIRGLRIELEEIENTIAKLPDIKTCLVVKNTDTSEHETLCAYYTSKSNVKISDIRSYLSKYLPNYMIPQYFMQIDSFNYTPNGKIDRKKLPKPEYNQIEKELLKPRNDIDENLLKLFEKLFNINKISIDDSFFELGGDSLLAINLCIQIKLAFDQELFVRDILEHPTIKELSDIISEKINSFNKQNFIENNVNTSTLIKTAIKPAPKADFYPVSASQKRIYFSSQVAGNTSTLYNIPGGIILEGTVDIEKLENCFNKLINRHESLRTYFEVHGENIVQKIVDKLEFELEIVDSSDFKNLHTLFNEFVKPFDLSKAPLFRARLIRFKDTIFALFVDMHHIISDGTSLSILVDELCKLYNGENLTELKITYKDFAVFENELLEANKLEKAEKYWLEQFKGELPVLNLTANHPRAIVQSFEGKKIYSVINAKTAEKIYNMANQLGITPYMLLLACYYILLSKYTSQSDIVVGSPIAGRYFPELNNLIGMFVNTLALRNNVNSKLSFKDFVLNIKENILDAYKYQAYPFDELVNKLDIKRDTSRNPLFDTMFIYQNNGYKDINLEGIKSEYYIPDTNISKFDLSLEAVPINNEIKLSFEYATNLFDEDFINNFSNHYLTIVNSVLENIDTKISDIDMLSEEEKNKILSEFNNTVVDYPRNKTIVELFEKQVKNTPDNLAVVFENEKLTYKELNEKANNLAIFLIGKGLKRNEIISIFLDKSLESIIAILAILKCGCAYMPIDIDYPQDRINYMIENSNSRFILTLDNLKSNLEKVNKEFCINIDLSNNVIYNNNSQNININSNPDDLAYIMYTSGSTGKPKGVMVSNRNVVRLVKNNSFIKFEPNDRILQTGSIVFDACTFEIWGALLNGLELYIIKKQDLLDSTLLKKYLEKNKITILWITAPLFNRLSEQNPKIFNTARVLLTGGDILSPKHINNVKDACPNLTIINGYGPTENTTFSTCFTIDKKYETSIPIGYPIANSTCYIVSKDNQLLPVGVPGELLVGGDGVSKGYLNNPANTKSKFIPNLFGNGILYKTGDFAKWNSDGSISFIGRLDNQVKIRGFRVELNEISLVIKKFNGIKECITIVREINSEKSICSYFSSDKKIDTNSLKTFLKSNLPHYSIPKYFINLDTFPLNANGKIDKSKLPIPAITLNSKNYTSPRTDLQKQMVKIWENILHVKNIGIDDNFFELGGDSLLAMNLNMELLKITNKITYADIFRYPTITQLEDKIISEDNKPLFNKIEDLPDEFVDILDNSTKREKIEKYHPKNVLLTGATGFLGIHILEEFINKETGNIYCIVRERKGLTAKSRLIEKLNYYFGNKYDNLIDTRIFAIAGDTSKPDFGLEKVNLLKLANCVDVVINSAAIVAHYGNYSKFYNANVKSVKYIVDFCKTFNKKFYHISTRSVSGRELDTSYVVYNKTRNYKIKFKESSLYIGQIIDSVYSRSKFEAESYILNSINKGLDAYILRMGNLMPRFRDGIFQDNIYDNNFLNKIVSYVKLGFIPDYLSKYNLEFTPIDYAAKAILELITHPTNNNRIFHLYNHKTISVKKLLKLLNKLGYNIDVLSEDEFKNRINSILRNDDTKNLLKYLIDDFDNNFHLIYQSEVIVKSNFTIKYLNRINFKWPKITNKYLTYFINILEELI